MNPCKHTRILILLLVFSLSLQGQEDQNLYFVRKDRVAKFGEDDYRPRKDGFYLYRNCIYLFVLNNKGYLMAKVTDIRNDSIYYAPYSRLAETSGTDTLALHPGQLKKIKLVGDRIMGLYTGYNLHSYRYTFVNNTLPKKFDNRVDTIYAKDSSSSTVYERVPYMTAQGPELLYEKRGVMYYGPVTPLETATDSTQPKKPYVLKKVIWFSPTNANEIRGVNIGLASMTFRGDSFAVKGVNLNADILAMILTFPALIYATAGNTLINMPDTIDYRRMPGRISGFSASIGGLMTLDKLEGVFLNGGICVATQSKGLVVTGTQNLVDDFRGVIIAGIRNRSYRGTGLQLGLFNICKHLKGVQIGLWNVNSKRRLPFINWSF
jgi:hypothetical protein